MDLIKVLRRYIEYDPETGILLWKARKPADFKAGKYTPERQAAVFNGAYAGKPALNCKSGRTLSGRFGDQKMYAHRAAWMIHYGQTPPGQIDHINGDPADNRISNLRAADWVINARNKKLNCRNKSGYPGVYRRKSGRWSVTVNSRHRKIYLGSFETREEAVAAKRGAERAFGYHENHGRNGAM